MANGSVALQTLDPLSPAQLKATPTPEDKPEMARLRKIGEITADATITLAIAMQNFIADGSMASHTRERSGELFVQLYELQQSTMTDDFPQLMHIHGKQILWERHAGDFRQHIGARGLDEAAFNKGLDELIDGLCTVLRQTTAMELAWTAN